MADIAKAALGNRVLQAIGVLAAGATAASADTTLVEEKIDVAHEKLRRFYLAPFPTSAIPSWAQSSLELYTAALVRPFFGQPMTAAQQEAEFRSAERELQRQVAGYAHKRPVKATYY